MFVCVLIVLFQVVLYHQIVFVSTVEGNIFLILELYSDMIGPCDDTTIFLSLCLVV